MKVIRRINAVELMQIIRDAFDVADDDSEVRFNVQEHRGPNDESTGDW